MPGVLADRRVPVGRGDARRPSADDTGGYHRPRADLDPRSGPLPAVPAARRPVAAGAAAAAVGRARRPRRALDQARGPAAARLRREQAAEPRVPRRRRAGRGRRHPRHVRPALVEPRAADRRGRRAGGSRGPPRPVRAAGRPAQPGRRARRAARRDGPPGRDGRPGRARGARRARRGRPARGRPAAVRHRGRRIGRRPARSARCWPASSSSPTARPRGFVPRRRRRPVGDRRDPGRAAGRASDRPAARRSVHGVAVTPAPRSSGTVDREATSPALGGVDRLGAVARDATSARRRPARRRLRPADRGRRRGRPASSPGPRASWSTRSTPRRRWPGSSTRVRSGALDGHRVVFWHAGGTPGLFEPLAGSEG